MTCARAFFGDGVGFIFVPLVVVTSETPDNDPWQQNATNSGTAFNTVPEARLSPDHQSHPVSLLPQTPDHPPSPAALLSPAELPSHEARPVHLFPLSYLHHLSRAS